jgi:hypothetical protein
MVKRAESDLVYHTTPGARRRKWRRDAQFIGILAVLALIGGLCGWFAEALVVKWFPPLLQAIPFMVALAMILLAIRAVRARAIYTKGAALMAALSGAFIHSLL